MITEYFRLFSLLCFSKYQSKFSHRELAKVGFYCSPFATGVIKCASCSLKIENSSSRHAFESCDTAMQGHRTLSPRCPFVNQSSSVDNIPSELPTDHWMRPHHATPFDPDLDFSTSGGVPPIMLRNTNEPISDGQTDALMQTQRDRIESFRNSACMEVLKDLKIPLAGAGFYFTGFGDVVRCHHCQIEKNGWLCGHDPYAEHAKISPECDYLKTMMGTEFINRARNSKKKVTISIK